MNVLSVDTSTCCSVSIRSNNTTVSLEKPGKASSKSIASLVSAAMAKRSLTSSCLDMVSFNAGPGGFTAIRIGCGVAQAFGFVAGCPVTQVCGLKAIAHSSKKKKVLSVLPAHRGHIYIGAFLRREDFWHTVITPQICSLDQLPALPEEDGQWHGCGSGFQRDGEVLKKFFSNSLESSRSKHML